MIISLVTEIWSNLATRTGQKTGMDAQMLAVSTSRHDWMRVIGAYHIGSKVG
jgi:hypothetical protein